jgi:hypothetical protein
VQSNDDQPFAKLGIAKFGWVGGVVSWNRVLLESDRAFVALENVVAYPEGLTFDLAVHRLDRGPRSGQDVLPTFLSLRGFISDLRVLITFSDGREASNQNNWDLETVPTSPVLEIGGGHGSGTTQLRETVHGWLWPLPPEGDLVWQIEVPMIGLERSSVILSAHDARLAALEAREVLRVAPPGTSEAMS